MRKVELAFVILHYMTFEDTDDCIVSIRKNCDMDKCRIVVVDNCSTNDSYKKLTDKYGQDDNIDFVHSDENLGFARGNNLGIEYVRNNYMPKYIMVMNNDILLLHKNIFKIIDEEFNRSSFAVMGPMIYTADATCNSNPVTNVLNGAQDLQKRIKYLNRQILIYRLKLVWFYNILYKLKKSIKKRCNKKKNDDSFAYINEDCQLHGCCLIFSEKYFEKFTGFYPGTFLYMEEDILYYLLNKEGLMSVYTPELRVYHKENSASAVVWNTNTKRMYKKYMYMLDSAKKMQKLMESEK